MLLSSNALFSTTADLIQAFVCCMSEKLVLFLFTARFYKYLVSERLWNKAVISCTNCVKGVEKIKKTEKYDFQFFNPFFVLDIYQNY